MHDPRRIRAWHALLADSLFTSSGTAEVSAYLGWRRLTSGTPFVKWSKWDAWEASELSFVTT